MRITADWINRPETRAVLDALASGGQRAFFVGGCVRNALLGVPVGDIDIATDAAPETVMALAEKAGLKPVPTGMDHGTITVVSSGVPHEVTTFRADTETDGRRAKVVFGQSIEADARRRDFTMNALYAAPDGAVIDPLGGLPDLCARRVRFVGEAGERIREDYLRILRFFRFHACYGDPEGGLDAEGLAACAAARDGLVTLSHERIGAEMRKLLAARDPAPSVAAMQAAGVLAVIRAGGPMRARLPRLCTLNRRPASPPTRSAALPRWAARMWRRGCGCRGPRRGGLTAFATGSPTRCRPPSWAIASGRWMASISCSCARPVSVGRWHPMRSTR